MLITSAIGYGVDFPGLASKITLLYDLMMLDVVRPVAVIYLDLNVCSSA